MHIEINDRILHNCQSFDCHKISRCLSSQCLGIDRIFELRSVFGQSYENIMRCALNV